VTLRRIGDEHVQVGYRTPHDLVENRIGAIDAGGARARFAERVAGGAHFPIEAATGPFVGGLGDAITNENAPRFMRLQRHLVGGAAGGQSIRRGFERQTRPALDLVQSHVPEHDAVAVLQLRERLAARHASFAAHFEQICEVGCKPQRQAHVQRAVAEIPHQQAFVAVAVPDELHAVQMDLFAAQRDTTVDQQIRVAEVGAEHCVVVLSHRTQQQRPRFFEK